MKVEGPNYATLALTSTIVTAACTSLHHYIELGFSAMILLILFVAIPVFLIQRFRNTGSRWALRTYGILNAWLIVGFGVVDGLWNHIVKPLGLKFHELLAFHGGGANVTRSAVEGGLLSDITGMLTFFASIGAAYFGYKYMISARLSTTKAERVNQ